MLINLAMLAAAAAQAAPAPQAPPPPQPASARIRPGGDPAQVVCIVEFQPGSRIVRRRVCRTRAEWAEHRSIYRQQVERAQQQFQTDYPD